MPRYLLLVLLTWYIPSAAQDAVTTIILVRHAEKDTAQIDPALSPAGVKRVRDLETVLAKTKIDAILSTQYRRTYDTVEPLAKSRGLQVQIVMRDPTAPLSKHIDEVVQKIMNGHVGKTVLVSSHSNIIPEIIKKLGVSETVTIDERIYDDLFVVTRSRSGAVSLLRLKYGTPTP